MGGNTNISNNINNGNGLFIPTANSSSFRSSPNGFSRATAADLNDSTSSTTSCSSSSTTAAPSPPLCPHSPLLLDAADISSTSSDLIYLYLPEQFKSAEIKENLISSISSLIKSSKQIKLLDEEAYLMRKVAVNNAAAAAAAVVSNNSTSSSPVPSQHHSNIFDHYRVYNELILPNLNSLSKNVKDSVVLFALDHADAKMLEILRDHPCIPVTPSGRKLKKPNKLVHPSGRVGPLYSEADERFPCGSEDTYIRDDRLQVLKILGMKCDQLSWSELVERAESINKVKEFEVAVERAVVVLSILNEMISNNSGSSSRIGRVAPTSNEELKACELLKEIPFVPVKPRPYSGKLGLPWCGDKFRFRFAKPRELMSAQYEQLCSSVWPVPLTEYKTRENIVSKQIEHFFGIDDPSSASKLSVRDVLKHLDELAKLNLDQVESSSSSPTPPSPPVDSKVC